MSQPTERLSAWGAEPPLWVRLLDAEVQRTNITAAAKRIGMNRATVSTVLRNCYPSLSTAGVERRVMDALGRLDCPAQGAVVTVVECQAFREKPAPTHNPLAMQRWKASQHCPHNPSCHAQESRHADRR